MNFHMQQMDTENGNEFDETVAVGHLSQKLRQDEKHNRQAKMEKKNRQWKRSDD